MFLSDPTIRQFCPSRPVLARIARRWCKSKSAGMARTLLLGLTGLLLLASAAGAQEKRTLLLIPFEMGGTYFPIQQADFTNLLEKSIEQVAPNVSVTVHSQKAYMLSPEEATRIGKDAGVDLVLYGDVRFRKEVKGASVTGGAPEGYPGGSGVNQGFSGRMMVTVAGIGHGKLVDVAKGELIAERPELLMESEYTGAPEGSATMETLEKKLARSCVDQMSGHLIESLKRDAKK